MFEINMDKISEDELVEAANRIFTAQVEDFEKIKTEKWYQTLFHAITLNHDGKKYAVRGIKSLSKLQQMFMTIYFKNYRKTHEQLDAVIDAVIKNSEAIKKLYGICVLNLEGQESLKMLEPQDAEILAKFLGEYRDENGSVPTIVQNYNRGVLKALSQGVPSGALDRNQIRSLKAPKIVYRCFMEQCAVDGTIDTEEWTERIKEDLKDFELSDNSKEEIKESVKEEADIAGIEYFLNKYTEANTSISDKDFEIDNNAEANKDEDEVDNRSLDYLEVKKKENIEISNECAQIYFKDCYLYDKKMVYIESSSFVIFQEDDNITSMHKKSGKKNILLEKVEKAEEYIKKGKIVTYQDMAYYVKDNDLFYIDIDSEQTGRICHIEEVRNDDGELYDVRGLMIYQGKKIIYRCGWRYYILDFMLGAEATHSFSIDSESEKCFLKGDYLYYVSMESDLDDIDNYGYRLKRYGILNDQETYISKPFGKHKLFDSIESIQVIEAEGIFDNKYFCVFGYQGEHSSERVGFNCFYFNLDNSEDEPHRFYIWNSRVFQIEQYEKYIVYVNADKGYSLIRHNIVEDKKKVLLRNYGETEKASFSEILFLGKSSFMKPLKYMKFGKWLWVKEKDKLTPQIISIC